GPGFFDPELRARCERAHQERVLLESELTRPMLNVRFGSLADIRERTRDVRFTPRSGHAQRRHRCLLSAISGHHRLAQTPPPRAGGYSAAPSSARSSDASSPRATAATRSSPNCPNVVEGWSYSNTPCPASFSYSTTRIGA